MRILIADDERSFVELLSERLEKKGNDVECAYDGMSALKLIKSKRYDVIILDHNMPELTGLELIKYIKKNGIGSKTVMITGYSEIDRQFMKAVGVDGYLTKPVKIADLDALIEKYSNGI